MTDHRTPPSADAIRAAHGAHRGSDHYGQLGRGCRTCTRYLIGLTVARITDEAAAARWALARARILDGRVTITACPTTDASPAPPSTGDPTRPNANGT